MVRGLVARLRPGGSCNRRSGVGTFVHMDVVVVPLRPRDLHSKNPFATKPLCPMKVARTAPWGYAVALTPQAFIAKWLNSPIKERAGA